MEINELFIGAWVMDGIKPAQVTGLTCDGIVETTDNESSNIEMIEPITLTKEILEKNGFTGGEYESYVGYVFRLSMAGFREIGLTMGYKNNILWCERIKKDYPNSIGDNYSICHLDYVHQLQQALRLCGIDKEIILA